jgi:hypothetical protein
VDYGRPGEQGLVVEGGVHEASGEGKATDTATRTAEETGAEPGGQAGMRPTGSGGSARPKE